MLALRNSSFIPLSSPSDDIHIPIDNPIPLPIPINNSHSLRRTHSAISSSSSLSQRPPLLISTHSLNSDLSQNLSHVSLPLPLCPPLSLSTSSSTLPLSRPSQLPISSTLLLSTPYHPPPSAPPPSRPSPLHSLPVSIHNDDLSAVNHCCVSVSSSVSRPLSSAPHHHLCLDQQSNFSSLPIPSAPLTDSLLDSAAHWAPWEDSAQMVRHTTKLLKSRDSRTGRLIINQYMKGKEIGRGVHGIVYIGKNMDKVIRASTPSQPGTSANKIVELLEEPFIQPSISSAEQAPEPTSASGQSNNDSDGQPGQSARTDEDYETVAIKVVCREPRGPKSLRRSQLQRQREREAQALGSPGWADAQGYLVPGQPDEPGRAPLLKDVDDKLKKEIAIMKRLRHRHIVQLKEVIDDAKSKKVFMILEFMEGGQVIWQDPLQNSPLMTVDQARRTFRQVLLGLEYLHYQGIIHRDIKPANLLWTADRETVKISDFGVSHISGVLKRSASSTNLSANLPATSEGPRTTNSTDDKALRKTEGSPAFMAPELCCPVEATPLATPPEKTAVDYFTQLDPPVKIPELPQPSVPENVPAHRLISLPLPANTFARGERPAVGKAIDIWALGVTLFCLLFGRTPFNAPNEYELFNVIWNEPIVVPEKMGVEGQPIKFDPNNPASDGPVERDARELVDLLRRLLEKDPQRRICLEDVKIHPWVLNNLDNTQYWVHETAPVGGDAVFVTTEEVANFSRPRASLTSHKPLGGVRQSLRKAAIKLGLQRPSVRLLRFRSKSVSSTSTSTSPKLVSPLPPPLTPLPAPRKSPAALQLTRQKIVIDTSNLESVRKATSSPISPSPLSMPLSSTSLALKRGLTCGGWGGQATPKATPNGVPLPITPSQPSTPVMATLPVDGCFTPDQLKGPIVRSSLSPLSSRVGSPSQSLRQTPRSDSPASSPQQTLAAGQPPAPMHTHHPHMLTQLIVLSKLDRIQQRRSLPSSPAPLHALASLSRSSLLPPRACSPTAVSEGSCAGVKPSGPMRFRDALLRVKQRFSRSRSRGRSQTSSGSVGDVTRSMTETGGGVAQVGRRFYEGVGSEVFTSDTEPSCEGVVREEEEPDGEGSEEEEEEEEDDGSDEEVAEEMASGAAQGPLMYHDGTRWAFPRVAGEDGIGRVEGGLGPEELGLEWGRPRLTIRPASVVDGEDVSGGMGGVEYRSSSDDDEDGSGEGVSGEEQWRWSSGVKGCLSAPVRSGSGRLEMGSQVSGEWGREQQEEEHEEEEEEGNGTLQIEVRRRKRGSSKSEGS